MALFDGICEGLPYLDPSDYDARKLGSSCYSLGSIIDGIRNRFGEIEELETV